MAITKPDLLEDDLIDDPPVHFVTREEGRRMFDAAVRAELGYGGDEFIRRWEAGEFADVADKLEHRNLVDLVLMIPLGR